MYISKTNHLYFLFLLITKPTSFDPSSKSKRTSINISKFLATKPWIDIYVTPQLKSCLSVFFYRLASVLLLFQTLHSFSLGYILQLLYSYVLMLR